MKPIILTHVGSNNFVREVYRPDLYSHRVTLAGMDGEDKTAGGEMVTYDIAGPLCFQVIFYLNKSGNCPINNPFCSRGTTSKRIWSFQRPLAGISS